MTFPSTLSTFNRPATTDRLNSPSHSALHNTVSSALGQVEAVIGLAGAVSTLGTIQYDLRSPASDGGGHVQTANKGGTGQTSYNKGDILVASSSSVLTKVAVGGSDGTALVVDSTTATGVKWGVPNSQPTIRTYSSVVTIWYKPSTISYAIIEVVGAGGAGGGTTSSGPGGCSGGAGGGYGLKVVPASSLPLAASVFAGVGGSGGNGNGTAGGNSYFGSIMFAGGGTAGQAGNGGNAGVGGSVLTGDINISGGNGYIGGGNTGYAIGGSGGSSKYGFGGVGKIQSGGSGASTGENGQLFGSGGSGGTTMDTTDVNGGNGAGGIVIIYEY